MYRKKSFTIVELLFVIIILSLILPTIFFTYNWVQRTKQEISIRQQLVQQTYEIFERINVLMQDYTIDYEEYFNRKMVGCTSIGGKGDNFTWQVNGSGYCNNFTAYGNGNSLGNSSKADDHILYYCSSYQSQSLSNNPYITPVVKQSISECSKDIEKQSFGQYSKLFYDVKNDTDNINGLVNDSDDEDLGQ
ncbi:MAG: type II secretion system GspH family protein [Candidatus Peribacteria bacterium]|jgi:type II secretory pathway pseudopilin PulG|nr:type II secretion system GspH family protein [Candidatus Peribacteria bacterium]